MRKRLTKKELELLEKEDPKLKKILYECYLKCWDIPENAPKAIYEFDTLTGHYSINDDKENVYIGGYGKEPIHLTLVCRWVPMDRRYGIRITCTEDEITGFLNDLPMSYKIKTELANEWEKI